MKYIFAKRTMHVFKRQDTFDEEVINQLDPRYITEGRAIPAPGEVKPEPVPVEVKEKLEEIKEDLMDDGKLNHSNDDEKKSPGRPKKKKGLFGKKK